MFMNVPGVVERLLDLVHQRNNRVEQQAQTERADHSGLDIFDKTDDARRNFGALVTEGAKKIQQRRLKLVVNAKRFQHRKGDSEERHQREQRGEHQAGRPQAQLAAEEVADDGERDSQPADQPRLPAGEALDIGVPDPCAQAPAVRCNQAGQSMRHAHMLSGKTSKKAEKARILQQICLFSVAYVIKTNAIDGTEAS